MDRITAVVQSDHHWYFGSHNHVDSQALGKVRHRLVNVFLWQLFRQLCRVVSAHQSYRLRLEFMVLFQHNTPDMIVRRDGPVLSALETKFQ